MSGVYNILGLLFQITLHQILQRHITDCHVHSPRENCQKKRERIEFEKFAHVSSREIMRVPVVSVFHLGVAAIETSYNLMNQNINTVSHIIIILIIIIIVFITQETRQCQMKSNMNPTHISNRVKGITWMLLCC